MTTHKIFMLVHPGRKGDTGAIHGIAQYMKASIGPTASEVITVELVMNTSGTIAWDASMAAFDTKAATSATVDTHLCVVAASDFGMEFCTQYAASKGGTIPDHMRIFLSSHQVFPTLGAALPHIHRLYLPAHISPDAHTSVAEAATSGKLVQEPTIPVTFDTELVAKGRHTAQAHQSLSPHEKTTAVILGGHAPDESGEDRAFTVEDAQRLHSQVLALHTSENPSATLIYTNGPSTGKGKDMPMNDDPHCSKDRLDDCTHPAEMCLAVARDPVLKARRATVWIADIDSMNDTHKAHADTFYEAGLVGRLIADGRILKPKAAEAKAGAGDKGHAWKACVR